MKSRPLIIALHAAIALPLAYLLNIWMDEASSLYTTGSGVLHAFQSAAVNEEQAPLYFWILSLWRYIDGSIFFARVFSILCSGVSIWLFYGLASRFSGPRGRIFATAFFALHPMLIWASLEIRPYALLILLSLLLVKLLFDGFLDPDHRASARIFFLVAAVAALYTNYYLGFLLLALFVPLVLLRRGREAAIYLAMMAITGIVFIPLALQIQSQFAAKTSGYIAPQSVIDCVRTLSHHFLTFLLPTGVTPDIEELVIRPIRAWIVRGAAAIALFFMIKQRKDITQQTFVFLTILAAVGLCMMGAYFMLGVGYIMIRHATILFVPTILFVASLTADLTRKAHPRTNTIIFSIIACLAISSFSYSLVKQYPTFAKRGDWVRVGKYIELNESSDQPIIVFTTYEALALPNHYRGVNRVLPDERFFEFELEAESGSLDSYKNQIDFVISKIPADADEIWLLVPGDCAGTPACLPLENYVEANYTVEKEQEFYLEKVFLLRRKDQ